MRLLILGANGKTGTQLVDLALARDHEVTAFGTLARQGHAPPSAVEGASR